MLDRIENISKLKKTRYMYGKIEYKDIEQTVLFFEHHDLFILKHVFSTIFLQFLQFLPEKNPYKPLHEEIETLMMKNGRYF